MGLINFQNHGQVGTAGKLGGSAKVKNARGEWHNLVTGLNRMVDRVTGQVRGILVQLFMIVYLSLNVFFLVR